MDNVAIIGVGQTKYEQSKPADTYADLVYEVTTKALDDAGLTIDDIDNVVTVSNDFWDGRTISSMAITDAAGAANKNVSTIEGDGTFGALYGLMRILSGSYGTTLVVAHSKASEGSPALISNAMFDPIYYRPLGLDDISSAALQARRYMDKYLVTEEQCALVSVKNHRNAKANPYAQLPADLTVEQVMESKPLAEPIKLWDISPNSDGAAAIILASEERAKTAAKKPVWVKGVGHCADAFFLGDRDLADVNALMSAAKRAYQMSGIDDPLKQIQVAELYDAFTYQELMWMEGLGFCDRGQAGRLLEKGLTEREGTLAVNPSGGVLSAHAVLVAGLTRMIEATLQIRGEAGERQVDGVMNAIAHGINGACGQGHCVWVLGSY